ncbi:MAG: PAS domain-containing protein, partial [Thermodesulfobacteriota bacterium]
MHKLLERQLKKSARVSYNGNLDYNSLVEMINSTYEEFDRERQLTNRSIELASTELLELNRKIQEQSKARVQAIMDNVVDGIITCDRQGLIESFNPAAERIFGCSAVEIISRNISLLIPRLDEVESKYVHRKQGVGVETIGQRTGGSIFPIDLAISEMNFDEKSVFICVIRDITESKRVKDELTRLASFPIQNPNPIIEMDLSGNLHYMNPAAQRHFPDLNKTGNNHRIFEGVRSAIATFQREKYDSATYEVDLGDAIYEQKLWYTPENELIRIYMTDITERKQAEEALKGSLAQLSRKSHYEAVISTVTRSVHQSINLQDVLENAVESMKQNIERVKNVSIYMVEGDGELSRAEAVIAAY